MKKFVCWLFVALLVLPVWTTSAAEPRSTAPRIEAAASSEEGLWVSWLQWGKELFERIAGSGEHGPLIDPNGRSASAREVGPEAEVRARPLPRARPTLDRIHRAGQHGPLIDPNGIAR